VPALLWPSHGRTAVEVMQISIRALMRVLEPDLKAGGCPSNELYLYYLIGLHATKADNSVVSYLQ
jgi:hypothetical protein